MAAASAKRGAVGEVPAAARPANPHGAPDGVEGQGAWVALLAGMAAYARARRAFGEADEAAAARGAGAAARAAQASKGKKEKVVASVWVVAHPPVVDPVARALGALRDRGVTHIVSPPLGLRGKVRIAAWLRRELTSVEGASVPRALLLPLLGQYTSAELGAMRAELGAVYVAGAKSATVSVARRQASLPFVLATYATPAAPHTRGAFDRVRWARQLTLWPERSPPSRFHAFAQRRARELGLPAPSSAASAVPVHVNAYLEMSAAGIRPPPLPWGGGADVPRSATDERASYGLARHCGTTPTEAASTMLRAAVRASSDGGRVPGPPEWDSGVFARHLWWHTLLTMGSTRGGSATRPGSAAAAAGHAASVCALQAADSAARGALARGGSAVTSRGIGLSEGLVRAVRGAVEARVRLGLAASGTSRRERPGLHPGLASGGLEYRRDFAEALRAGAAARNNATLVWTRVLRDTGGVVFCPDLAPGDAEVGLSDVTTGGSGRAVAEVLEGMCGMVGLPAERWGGRDFVSVRYGKLVAAHI